MKRSVVCAIFISTAAADYAEAAFKSVGLENNTSADITGIYVSRAGANNWHSLGQVILKPGYSATANIHDKSSHCFYDFILVFSSGSESVHQSIDVCDGYTMVISNTKVNRHAVPSPYDNIAPFDINNPLEGLPLIENDPRLTPSRPSRNNYDNSYDCAKCKRNLNDCWQRQSGMKSAVNSSYMSSTCSSMADSCNRICGQ